MNSLRLTLILSSLVAIIQCISISPDKFHTLISERCFNETYDRKPWTLGQNYPTGLSIDNLISLIEKVESELPTFTAQQMIVLILRRFHIDGLRHKGGSNTQTQVEMKHRRITEEIFQSSAMSSIGDIDFPEDALTEDEKCNMFYTISHTINKTAVFDEDPKDVYQRSVHLSRAPASPVINRTVVPSPPKKTNVSSPIQGEFLPKSGNKSVLHQRPQPAKAQESKPQPKQTPVVNTETDNKRIRRADQNMALRPQTSSVLSPNFETLTRKPREEGVASFLNDKNMAIAVNRVLMGTAVGLLQPTSKTTRDLIKAINNIKVDDRPDGQIDPLLAVTLSDLLGIDAGSSLTIPVGDELFGASGEWNSTYCQTRYTLTSNGSLATMAELRGGLDGWNIGRKLPAILQQNPSIRLSQILRQYYSAKGLSPDCTVCNRGYGLVGELQNKVQKDAQNYIRVWNGVYYDNNFYDNEVTGFVDQTWPPFYRFLNVAGNDKPSDERDFCNPNVGTDIKTAPLETASDVMFMMDNMPAQGDGFGEEIDIITQVVKSMSLGRNAGSVSVFVNSQGSNNPSIVDENNVPINTPLYALAYNTTSAQCASCRAVWFDNRQMSLTDRPLIMELINRTLMDFETKKIDLSGVPSKNFVWFDFGNLKPAPTDREQKRKYEDYKYRLRWEHRDVTFFMATINKDNIKDLLRRDEDWIQLGSGDAQSKGKDLVNKIAQTPQVFQHNECRVKKSENRVYEGMLTPGYKQYWAMYPEYFIKSYTIDMIFKAENAKIKVCFDRNPNPEREERRCQEAKDDGGEVTLTVRNPCQGKTFTSCPAFHFAISLNTQSGAQVAGGVGCTDSRCRSPDQIKWWFTHTGVSCNASLNLLPKWWTQLICFILFLTIFCINGKRNQYLD